MPPPAAISSPEAARKSPTTSRSVRGKRDRGSPSAKIEEGAPSNLRDEWTSSVEIEYQANKAEEPAKRNVHCTKLISAEERLQAVIRDDFMVFGELSRTSGQDRFVVGVPSGTDQESKNRRCGSQLLRFAWNIERLFLSRAPSLMSSQKLMSRMRRFGRN